MRTAAGQTKANQGFMTIRTWVVKETAGTMVRHEGVKNTKPFIAAMLHKK
jgi:hypothetical protein